MLVRPVIVERAGRYSEKMGFAGTLYQAYDLLGLTPPPPDLMDKLAKDPRAAVHQTLYLAVLTPNPLDAAKAGRSAPPSLN